MLFAALLAALLLAGKRTLVYHTVTPARVSVVAVAADGGRTALETPDALKGVWDGLRRAGRRIRAFQETPAALELTPPGGRLEWSIRYSVDLLRFDQVSVMDGKPLDGD